MSAFRGIGQSHTGDAQLIPGMAGVHEHARRPARSTRLGTGTLACPRCDAPVAIGVDPVAITAQLSCPFCQRRGPARDFLSLASPSRPARVAVYVSLPGVVGPPRSTAGQG